MIGGLNMLQTINQVRSKTENETLREFSEMLKPEARELYKPHTTRVCRCRRHFEWLHIFD